MVDNLSFEISGLEQAMAKLESVAETPKRKATRFAMRKSANVIREAARRRAQRLDDPKTANSIADNVVVRFDSRHFRRTGDLKFSVGIRGGSKSKAKNASNPGGDTWYWRLVEFGTEHSRAQPFMRPAMAESMEPATDEFVRHLDKAIDRAIKRANRGQ